MIKINRIKYHSHPVLGNEEITFVEKSEINNTPYLSLIIGQNGTGKSKVLVSVVDIILYLKRYSENHYSNWNENYGFEIDFFNGNRINSFKKTEGSLLLNEENAKEKLAEIQSILPKKILALAYTFNDNFLFPDKKNKSSIYEYYGIRTVSNAIFTKKPTEVVFKNLQQIIDEQKENILDPVFISLGFKKKVQVTYLKNSTLNKLLKSSKFKKILNQITTKRHFKDLSSDLCIQFSNLVKELTGLDKKERNKRFADDAIFRVLNNPDSIKKHLFDFALSLNKNDNQLKLDFSYSWDEKENSENTLFKKHKNLYEFLNQLDLISFDRFSVFRDHFFDFGQASSGEFHFLHVYSALANSIEENSIVLIDEPEISLHPNWQQSWYDLLRPIINNSKSSHLIVSSHSHLIVSDLPPKTSSINTLRRVQNLIEVELMTKKNPFAWSSEQVLLDVFEMATDRNFYLAERMQKIVEELTKSNPNLEKVNILRDELKLINRENLDPNDPLNEVLKYLLDEEMA